MYSSSASVERDDGNCVDSMLEDLASGKLARRIEAIARQAAARHMLLAAQEMQFAVEAENSTD